MIEEEQKERSDQGQAIEEKKQPPNKYYLDTRIAHAT